MIDAIRDSFIKTVARAVEHKIDGRAIVEGLDKHIDKNFSPSVSAYIQKDLMTNLIFEMLEGIHKDDTAGLKGRVEKWLTNVK